MPLRPWDRLFDTMLSRLITDGTLTVTRHDGTRKTYGTGGAIAANMVLRDATIARDLCLRPEMALGEGYTDARIDTDDLFALCCLLFANYRETRLPAWVQATNRARLWLRTIGQRNSPTSSGRNAAHSYDLTDELFELFLDADQQYTAAYFHKPGMTLEEAQIAKRHHIGKKLMIEPGMRVLDIDCGWGSLATTLAQDFGAHVTGVNLSGAQVRKATARAADMGLADSVTFQQMDYRQITGTFDRVVSVGNLEHIGLPQYPTYLKQFHDRLAPDGIALIHTVGRNTPPSNPNAWLVKYIFPGGYAPALSEIVPVIEKSGLKMTDIEVWRGHYGHTIHEWRMRAEANADRIRALFDDRFMRMWRFYLAGTEAVFFYGHQVNYQIQMAHDAFVVPNSRDYLHGQDSIRTQTPFPTPSKR